MRRASHWLVAILLLTASWLCGETTRAHDGPRQVIDRLTLSMAESGQTLPLLYQRACEYRSLGQLERAESDLRQALRLAGASSRPAAAGGDGQARQAARIELAQILLAGKKSAAALGVIDEAMRQVVAPKELPPLLIVRCDVLQAQGRLTEALADCRIASQGRPEEVDWHLKRSQLQVQLGLHADRIASLVKAKEQTGSAVLESEWIDALLDAGRAQEAIEPIEVQLAGCRLRSSWLIRRARANQMLEKEALASRDLSEAIAEIDLRIHAERPDLSLIADRGFAQALLGDRAAARRDLAAIKASGAEPWMVWRLESCLASRLAVPSRRDR